MSVRRDGASDIGECFFVGPALLVRFAQGARGAFSCAITALGEFRFQLIDFFHAALQFRTERGDFFQGETVEGHFRSWSSIRSFSAIGQAGDSIATTKSLI
jgi:hypothetical protein